MASALSPRKPRVYLDWNASAPLSQPAREAIAAHLAEAGRAGFNPSSQHGEGRAARTLLEAARRDVAGLIGAQPTEITFTSGATEAANMVARGGRWDRILVSAVEHDCVLGAAESAAGAGSAVSRIPVSADGVVDLEALGRLLSEERGRTLVAVMAANNETGALQPVAEIVRLAKARGVFSLVDAAQAAAKTQLDFHVLGADFVVLSGHKIGGPTGIGALAMREGLTLAPLSAGGGQEGRRRPGTENLLGALGFAAAARAADTDAWAQTSQLRNLLETRLKNEAKGLVFCSEAVNRLPNTSCIAAPGWRAETQLMRLDLAGFAVSAGSACSSGKMAPSHVLRAMGFDEDLAACAIRVSLGPEAAREEIEAFAVAWLALYASRR